LYLDVRLPNGVSSLRMATVWNVSEFIRVSESSGRN
jgi:hypothetical protein